MQPGGLTPEARKLMLITFIAGGIFIFALALYTTTQVMSAPDSQSPSTPAPQATP